MNKHGSENLIDEKMTDPKEAFLDTKQKKRSKERTPEQTKRVNIVIEDLKRKGFI